MPKRRWQPTLIDWLRIIAILGLLISLLGRFIRSTGR